MNFEAVKVALKQDKNGFILTLCVHPDQIPEELLRDFVGARYGVAMVRINDDETPVVYTNRANKAQALVTLPAFQCFLGSENQSEATIRLCAMCDVETLADLNGSKKAQQLFDEIIKDYEDTDPFK